MLLVNEWLLLVYMIDYTCCHYLCGDIFKYCTLHYDVCVHVFDLYMLALPVW